MTPRTEITPAAPNARDIASRFVRERGDISLRLGDMVATEGLTVFALLQRGQEELMTDDRIGTLVVDHKGDVSAIIHGPRTSGLTGFMPREAKP